MYVDMSQVESERGRKTTCKPVNKPLSDRQLIHAVHRAQDLLYLSIEPVRAYFRIHQSSLQSRVEMEFPLFSVGMGIVRWTMSRDTRTYTYTHTQAHTGTHALSLSLSELSLKRGMASTGFPVWVAWVTMRHLLFRRLASSSFHLCPSAIHALSARRERMREKPASGIFARDDRCCLECFFGVEPNNEY
jgi:hypothetical protein